MFFGPTACRNFLLHTVLVQLLAQFLNHLWQQQLIFGQSLNRLHQKTIDPQFVINFVLSVFEIGFIQNAQSIGSLAIYGIQYVRIEVVILRKCQAIIRKVVDRALWWVGADFGLLEWTDKSCRKFVRYWCRTLAVADRIAVCESFWYVRCCRKCGIFDRARCAAICPNCIRTHSSRFPVTNCLCTILHCSIVPVWCSALGCGKNPCTYISNRPANHIRSWRDLTLF